MSLVAAIDQGTTSSRVLLVDRTGRVVASHQEPITTHYPRPGWVEHEPAELLSSVTTCMSKAMAKLPQVGGGGEGGGGATISAIGITNQRETTVVWDRTTGAALHRAIVWSDSRTAALCDTIHAEHAAAAAGALTATTVTTTQDDKAADELFRPRSGLPISTYFSGVKFRWLMENAPRVKRAVDAKQALFGTVDSWLLWNLTGGAAHVTDVTNASRTALMSLETCTWDAELCAALGVPMHVLPEIRSSAEIYGHVAATACEAMAGVPLAGCLGDQQAALVGQQCFDIGTAKNTYGTGCFMLMNTGAGAPVPSQHGLLSTVAYQLGAAAPVVYALEGSVAVAGSAISWFQEKLGCIDDAADMDKLALQVEDTGGAYLVPAFTGLLSPYWRPDARGVLVGLTHYFDKRHFARALLEACAYQTREVLDAMQQDTSGVTTITSLHVDGGVTNSRVLAQFQADILDIPVQVPAVKEVTASGAAFAAGLAVGFWRDAADLKRSIAVNVQTFEPSMAPERRSQLLAGWRDAVQRTFGLANATTTRDVAASVCKHEFVAHGTTTTAEGKKAVIFCKHCGTFEQADI
jgi:glycerol kinase